MKRTYDWIENCDNGWQVVDRITCEVTGEMENGTKVWTRLDDNGKPLLNEQFFAGRLCGYNFFSKF